MIHKQEFLERTSFVWEIQEKHIEATLNQLHYYLPWEVVWPEDFPGVIDCPGACLVHLTDPVEGFPDEETGVSHTGVKELPAHRMSGSVPYWHVRIASTRVLSQKYEMLKLVQ